MTTGLRVGELMALQWDDLNFNTGELRIERQIYQIKGELLIQPPKNKASIRTVILPPAVVTALKKYKQTVFSPLPDRPKIGHRGHGFCYRCGLRHFRLADTPVDPGGGLSLHIACDMGVDIQRSGTGDVPDDGSKYVVRG